MAKHKKPIRDIAQLTEGQELYSMATARVNPLFKSSRKAAEFIASQEGFIGVFTSPNGNCLWMFDTENNCKGARNMTRFHGMETGKNICKFVVKDGIPTFDYEFAKAHGLTEEN